MTSTSYYNLSSIHFNSSQFAATYLFASANTRVHCSPDPCRHAKSKDCVDLVSWWGWSNGNTPTASEISTNLRASRDESVVDPYASKKDPYRPPPTLYIHCHTILTMRISDDIFRFFLIPTLLRTTSWFSAQLPHPTWSLYQTVYLPMHHQKIHEL